jgi:hypothetical protein
MRLGVPVFFVMVLKKRFPALNFRGNSGKESQSFEKYLAG